MQHSIDYHFTESMDRIKLVLDARTQVALASCLGVTQSALSCAYRRGSIPPQWLLRILRQTGVNPDWILYGERAAKYLAPSADAPRQQAA